MLAQNIIAKDYDKKSPSNATISQISCRECRSNKLCLMKTLKSENTSSVDSSVKMAVKHPREKEVLDLMVEGKANKVIAADLNLSQRTVEVHRAHVMEKMAVRSLAEIVRLVSFLEQS